MTNTPKPLLEQIFFARYGTTSDAIGKQRFFRELRNFQQSLERSGQVTVTIPAIRKWFEGPFVSTPKRIAAIRFLHAYLESILERKLIPDGEQRLAFEAASNELGEHFGARKQSSGPQRARALRRDLDSLNPIIARAFQSLLLASDQHPRPIDMDLFRDGLSGERFDHSYYLMYRYSTTNGAVVKSFLVCQKPERNVVQAYGFNHFIWSGSHPRFPEHVYRECEGLIIKFEKSYYFLGYNYVVPINKRRHPEDYARGRDEARATPNGMGLLAIEYEDINRHPGLFSGVTMTLAAGQQPVLARVALLHLGTRSRMAIEVTDMIVEPTELFPSKIASDLKGVVERLQNRGCRRFGELLDREVQSKAWGKRGASQMAKQIAEMIRNTPAWEMKVATAKDPEAAKRPHGRGAIEAFGHLRD